MCAVKFHGTSRVLWARRAHFGPDFWTLLAAAREWLAPAPKACREDTGYDQRYR